MLPANFRFVTGPHKTNGENRGIRANGRALSGETKPLPKSGFLSCDSISIYSVRQKSRRATATRTIRSTAAPCSQRGCGRGLTFTRGARQLNRREATSPAPPGPRLRAHGRKLLWAMRFTQVDLGAPPSPALLGKDSARLSRCVNVVALWGGLGRGVAPPDNRKERDLNLQGRRDPPSQPSPTGACTRARPSAARVGEGERP